MTVFVTSVEKHSEIKEYVLGLITDELLEGRAEGAPIAIDIPKEKINEWYGEAIEEFRQHRLTLEGDAETVFDPNIIWVNIYRKGCGMNTHKHPDWAFYSIHYLQKDEEHPHTQMSDSDEGEYSDPEAVEGDIIFFEGDQWHRVQENPIDKLRISIGMSATNIETRGQDLEEIRKIRNAKLAETDYWELPSQPDMTQEKIDYRQNLRDITDKYISLRNIIWPEKP